MDSIENDDGEALSWLPLPDPNALLAFNCLD